MNKNRKKRTQTAHSMEIELVYNSLPWSEYVSTYSYYEKETVRKLNSNKNGDLKTIFQKYLLDESYCPAIKKADYLTILLLAWEYPPHLIGGLAKHVHGLSLGLQKLGYKVFVITANPGHLTNEEILEGVHIYRVRPRCDTNNDFLEWVAGLNEAIAEKALQLARLHSFSVIHAHDWLVAESAAFIKTCLKLPLISTIHATEHGRNNGIYTELQSFIHDEERQLVMISDHLIVCSEYMNEELVQIFEVSAKKIAIIPNGVEEGLSFESKKDELLPLPLQVNKRLIFSIGRIVKEKGFDTLIEAAFLMKDRYPDVYFIVAGAGPMLEDYRMRVMQLHLSNVFFVGFISEETKNALFKVCTLAVFPSRYEPFGIVALEAMQHGKPIIASKTGGLKSIVQHGLTGLLMEPGDALSFIKLASSLLENELGAKRMGLNGKTMVEKNFSWQGIAEDTVRVYEETLRLNV
ncbi:glycosyltransferase family 4 protein [Cytobacillus massiliigabonensis]|uniref:glycosyltransferase family 4 protein n=1 Tax=Cytobacillus massiliigabonensis TaxID=1871011 RepID=UPI001F2CA092|nr:glycosyltransferase family 4 protein [Cytobacillus massiliigabonensis]